jgi:hypothetical protein
VTAAEVLPLHNLVWDGTTAAPSATVTDTRQYVKDQLNMLRQVRRTEKERERERERERYHQRQRERQTAVSVTGLYF